MPEKYYYILSSDGELYHYGVKGMKWGVRKRIEDAYANARNRVRNSQALRRAGSTVGNAYRSTSKRIKSSNAYNRASNSKVGKQVQSKYSDWQNTRQVNAKATMQKYGGNTRKAMGVTAAKSFGTSTAIQVGGHVAQKLLGAAALTTGHSSLATMGNVIAQGTRVAGNIVAVNGAIKVADLYKESKKH